MKCMAVCFKFIIFLIVVNCVLCNPINNTTEGHCASHTDCKLDQVCVDQSCVDPCLDLCGTNTNCVLQDFQPVCFCKPGYEGHPFTECKPATKPKCTRNDQCPRDRACLNYKCVDPCLGACGLNSECRVVNHRHMCACKNGFYYNPDIGCQPSSVPECKYTSQCADELVCQNQICVDPCVGVCGYNTNCTVKHHVPACACVPGYSGDPFVGCQAMCLVEKRLAAKKKYLIINEPVTWFEALQECHSREMYIATVNDGRDWVAFKEVHKSTYPGESIWLGAHDLGVENKFVWMSNGRELSYSNWREEEPNSKNHHCLLCRGEEEFEWEANDCSELFYFACESY